MFDKDGKKYLDLISGFSVMNIGHGNRKVIDAITKQINDYMHLMVYGEIIETPQVAYAKKLTEHLPASLDCVYFTNSGAEATEGAMKLAKRYTSRPQIIAFKNSYHGSTQGALSIMGDEYWRNAYRPLLPGIVHADYNSEEVLQQIDHDTACVIMEVVQAEAGVIAADKNWLKAIRNKCNETGTLLVFDEIQTGFGRTGTLWAFEQYDVVPDILMLGKALGGGLPLGAFIASHEIMHSLTNNPVLGHISTFAGHPVSCAAGLAAFDVLLEQFKITAGNYHYLHNHVHDVASQIISKTKHPAIKAIRQAGLLMAVEWTDTETCINACQLVIKNGAITDWFLFAPNCMRIAPPLLISSTETNYFFNKWKDFAPGFGPAL
jgi:acetylornithine/succinyldiaminopimelate/putrescine aminotransferase